jgi:hypothetical protein
MTIPEIWDMWQKMPNPFKVGDKVVLKENWNQDDNSPWVFVFVLFRKRKIPYFTIHKVNESYIHLKEVGEYLGYEDPGYIHVAFDLYKPT